MQQQKRNFAGEKICEMEKMEWKVLAIAHEGRLEWLRGLAWAMCNVQDQWNNMHLQYCLEEFITHITHICVYVDGIAEHKVSFHLDSLMVDLFLYFGGPLFCDTR